MSENKRSITSAKNEWLKVQGAAPEVSPVVIVRALAEIAELREKDNRPKIMDFCWGLSTAVILSLLLIIPLRTLQQDEESGLSMNNDLATYLSNDDLEEVLGG